MYDRLLYGVDWQLLRARCHRTGWASGPHLDLNFERLLAHRDAGMPSDKDITDNMHVRDFRVNQLLLEVREHYARHENKFEPLDRYVNAFRRDNRFDLYDAGVLTRAMLRWDWSRVHVHLDQAYRDASEDTYLAGLLHDIYVDLIRQQTEAITIGLTIPPDLQRFLEMMYQAKKACILRGGKNE